MEQTNLVKLDQALQRPYACDPAPGNCRVIEADWTWKRASFRRNKGTPLPSIKQACSENRLAGQQDTTKNGLQMSSIKHHTLKLQAHPFRRMSLSSSTNLGSLTGTGRIAPGNSGRRFNGTASTCMYANCW